MSSIQSLRNQYDQLRLQSISSQYNKTSSTTKTAEDSKAYFQSDQIEISKEGLAALEAQHEGEMPPMDKPHGKPPMGPPPTEEESTTTANTTFSL